MSLPPKKYATATAFRRALEERLKQRVQKDGGDIQRLRRQVAFDRFLCRLFLEDPAPWVLKAATRWSFGSDPPEQPRTST